MTTPVSPTQAPHMETLGFDASADFHEYTIEWTPESATFWIDSELRYTWSEEIGLMTLPQNVLMTIWASDSPTWAGSVTEQTAGATAVYDWVELWTYDASATPAATVPGEITQPVAEQPVMAAPTETSGQAADSDDTDADSAGTAADATTPEAEGGDIPVSEPQASDSGEGDNPADGMPMPEPPMSIPSEAGEDEADTTGANESPPGEDAPFELLFRDDFDEFDGARWQLMTHSWDTNLALFAAEAAVVRDGVMELTLLEAPSGATDDTGASKSFLGAEVRSYDTIEYGRVRARMRLAKGSAVISALVTIYTPWPADDWNELDIEALGADTSRVQFNSMVYTGAPLEVPATTSVSPTQYPELVDLGFDSSAEYHVYTIEWTPEAVSFLVDDVLMHGWSERIDLMGLPQNVLLTIWASSSASWAGPVTSETAGARASYDWVEVYEYVP